jgi:hypothetical protein
MAKSLSVFGLEKGNITRDFHHRPSLFCLKRFGGVLGSLSGSSDDTHVLISLQDLDRSPLKFESLWVSYCCGIYRKVNGIHGLHPALDEGHFYLLWDDLTFTFPVIV